MQLKKRAFLYVCRKRGRSLLLFCVIFLLSAVSVNGLLLRRITELAVVQTRESLRGGFRIAPDMRNRENVRVSEADGQTGVSYIGQPLDEKIVNAVKGIQEVASHNAVIKERALLQGDVRLIDYNGKYQADPEAAHLVSLEADTDSSFADDFQKGRLKMTEGESIQSSDQKAAVISEKLASQNHWQVGDEIFLSSRQGRGQEIGVRIKGLFKVEEKQLNLDVAAPVHLLENRIYVDMASAELLTGATGADYIDFFVDDPARVAAIIEEIPGIDGINWKCFEMVSDIDEYERISEPLIHMGKLLDILFTVIGAMSIAVLSLMQIFFHKARGHETGILLSIGISKAEILFQHFIELIMIAWGALALSLILCFFAWNGFSGMIYGMTAMSVDGRLDVGLAVYTIITACGCGTIVLFLSVLFADLCLLRLSPKKILLKIG